MQFRSTSLPIKADPSAVLDVHGAHLNSFVINVGNASIIAHWNEAGEANSDEFVIPLSERGVTIQITLKPQTASSSVMPDTTAPFVPYKEFGIHITVKPAQAA